MTTENAMNPKLVFGDSQTVDSDEAWQWIDNHVWSGWRLAVVTATLPASGWPSTPDAAELRPWQPDHPRVPDPTTAFSEVVHLTTEVDPRVALLEPADLLVVGPRGPGVLKALRLGSTTEWLLQQPPAPMVIARGAGPTRNALVGADGSAHAKAALDALAAMPWVASLAVTVVVVDDGRVDTRRATDDARQALEGTGATTTVVEARGRAGTTLLAEIRRLQPDLVALGTRGLTGLRRLHLGSTASTIAHVAPCSVLVARAPTAD
jgi:nucleotide-binding universal stress UspA family protein